MSLYRPDLPQPFTFLCSSRRPIHSRKQDTHQSSHSIFLSKILLSLFPLFLKALLVTSTRLFPLQPRLTRPGPTFCVPGERLLVAFIAVIIRPLLRGPRLATIWREPRRWSANPRSLGSAPGKRILPPFGNRLAGPWHFNGVHALLYRKDGTRGTTGFLKKVLARSVSGGDRAAVDWIAIKDQRLGDYK